MRAGFGQQHQEQQHSAVTTALSDASTGGRMHSTLASTSSAGSGSTAPATSVAMWTAISNPLLLISHVLKRSMDLQQAATEEANPVEPARSPSLSALPSPTDGVKTTVDVCCEYVSVERHEEPSVDRFIQRMDSVPRYRRSQSCT